MIVITKSSMKSNPKNINVLIACEESQHLCCAFRERGFNAWSADLQLVRSFKHPEWHIPGDVSPLLAGKTSFMNQLGEMHYIRKWHLIISHPPCTYLCKVSSVHMVKDGQVDSERYDKMLEARQFFMKCLQADAPFVAVENPQPMARAELPPADCYVQPFWYGEKYSKKTLFWLRNLPPLMPEIINTDFKEFVKASRGKFRSRTFNGVAQAIAQQWGDYVLTQMNNDPKETKK